jgi:hypothetical protein
MRLTHLGKGVLVTAMVGCTSGTAISRVDDPVGPTDVGDAGEGGAEGDAGTTPGTNSPRTTASAQGPSSGDSTADGSALVPVDGQDAASASPSATSSPSSSDALHVEANKLVVGGRPTRLLGVNHSGSEYTCLNGSGIFEGPDADALAAGILSWGNINTVRIPLNEDCWLGINGVAPQVSGTTYQQAVLAYVAKLHAHGLFTIVDLHWNAPGSFLANAQQPMADADHSVDFWRWAASAFKGDAMTVFDLYNEPYLDASNAETSDPWECWLHGCTVTQGRNGVSGNWQSAGMQTLLDAVRASGATNVVMVGGLNYADDLTGWLAHVPTDPLHNLVASLHAYAGGPCAVSSCWSGVLEPLAAQVPIVTGELGEYDCGHTFIDSFMPWADQAGVSYVPWTWNTWDCGSGPSLITDYGGTPTGFGEGYRAHLMVTKP